LKVPFKQSALVDDVCQLVARRGVLDLETQSDEARFETTTTKKTLAGSYVLVQRAQVRADESLLSPKVRALPSGAVVVVDLVRGNRARLSEPCRGWVSLSNSATGADIAVPHKVFIRAGKPTVFPFSGKVRYPS